MSSTCHILAQNAIGHVVLFGETTASTPATAACSNLAFQYGTVNQWLTSSQLRWLARNIHQLDPTDLFCLHPHQERIDFSMPSTQLQFSFLLSELPGLKHLLREAVVKLHWREVLKNSLN